MTTLLFMLPAAAVIGGAAWAIFNGVCEHLEADDVPYAPRAAMRRPATIARSPALAVAPRPRRHVVGHIAHGLHR